MADSQRLKSVPEGIQLVSEVAAVLARRHEGRTHVLEITTYFPMDVASIGRILEELEAIDGVNRVQDDGICYHEIEKPDLFSLREIDIEKQEQLVEAPAFMRAVSTLKKDEDWVKMVREQHEILHIAAGAKHRSVELSYLTSRTEIPSAKVQSILNDFGAEGHIRIQIDEDSDSLVYTFPEMLYPKQRFQNNLQILEEVQAQPPVRISLWIFVAVSAIILLAIVILFRL
ncbi:MAG: hypothetical protein ACNA8W_15840 [Bradymonadaceae bacterium]